MFTNRQRSQLFPFIFSFSLYVRGGYLSRVSSRTHFYFNNHPMKHYSPFFSVLERNWQWICNDPIMIAIWWHMDWSSLFLSHFNVSGINSVLIVLLFRFLLWCAHLYRSSCVLAHMRSFWIMTEAVSYFCSHAISSYVWLNKFVPRSICSIVWVVLTHNVSTSNNWLKGKIKSRFWASLSIDGKSWSKRVSTKTEHGKSLYLFRQ